MSVFCISGQHQRKWNMKRTCMLHRIEVVTAWVLFLLFGQLRQIVVQHGCEENTVWQLGWRVKKAEINMDRQKKTWRVGTSIQLARRRCFPLVWISKHNCEVAAKGRDLWGKIKLVLNIAPLICDDDACAAVAEPKASPPPWTLSLVPLLHKLPLNTHMDVKRCSDSQWFF